MSLAFGSRFTFRFKSKPARQGTQVPTQRTEMFGAVGASFLRGERMTGKLTYEVMQDGFVSQTTANAFVDGVLDEQGHVDSLVVTGRTTCTACLMGFTEARVVAGGGTTTGWSVRGTIEFEEVAT